MSFDHYIGIDWSGRKDYSADRSHDFPIQLARVDQAAHTLRLVEPHRNHNPRWKLPRWSRTTTVEWLHQTILDAKDRGERLLIGLDFAFGFPLADGEVFFPDLSDPQPRSWSELSETIQSHVGDDFSPNDFIEHPRFSPYFKWPEHQGDRHIPRLRRTERCAFPNGIQPTSVFHLIGGNQVGRGSVAGIACLFHLRKLLGATMFLWPLDGSEPSAKATAVFVEIWPRLLYEMAGVPSVAHRYSRVFELALRECSISNANTLVQSGEPGGENCGDALISAAALLHFVEDEGIWSEPGRQAAEHFGKEGWIWGAGYREAEI